MTQRVESFWHWRVHTSRKNIPLQAGAIVTLLVAISFFLNALSVQKYQLHTLRGLFLRPTFIIAILVLTASQICLDYMEYKVQVNMPIESGRTFLLKGHKIIPQMYREIHGTDLLLRFWHWRLIYVAFALWASVRWLIV